MPANSYPQHFSQTPNRYGFRLLNDRTAEVFLPGNIDTIRLHLMNPTHDNYSWSVSWPGPTSEHYLFNLGQTWGPVEMRRRLEARTFRIWDLDQLAAALVAAKIVLKRQHYFPTKSAQ